jgi:hypothetical protein
MPDTPITVVETPQFVRQADDIWSDAEREDAKRALAVFAARIKRAAGDQIRKMR